MKVDYPAAALKDMLLGLTLTNASIAGAISPGRDRFGWVKESP